MFAAHHDFLQVELFRNLRCDRVHLFPLGIDLQKCGLIEREPVLVQLTELVRAALQRPLGFRVRQLSALPKLWQRRIQKNGSDATGLDRPVILLLRERSATKPYDPGNPAA